MYKVIKMFVSIYGHTEDLPTFRKILKLVGIFVF